jgi:hypothetical protein
MRENLLKRKISALEPHEAAELSATRTETDDEREDHREAPRAFSSSFSSSSSSSSSSYSSSSSSIHPLSLADPMGASAAEFSFSSQGSPRSPNSTKQAMLYAVLSKSIAPGAVEPQRSSTAYMKPEIKEKPKEQAPPAAKQAAQTRKADKPGKAEARPRAHHDSLLQMAPAPMPMSIPGKLMLQNNHYAKTSVYSITKSKRQLMAEQVLTQQKEYFAPALPRPPALPKTYVHGKCLCGTVSWVYEGEIPSATLCNCMACRRYGALWAYSYLCERITTSGPTTTFSRGDHKLEFHFCTECGCMAFWRASKTEIEGKVRVAVNLRMAEPKHVRDVPIKMFDGLTTMSPIASSSSREVCFVRDLGV